MPHQLVIDAAFQRLLIPLNADEFDLLEQNILTNGCLDSLKVANIDGDQVLIDGHNRLRICEKHGMSYDVKPLAVDGRDGAHDWIINNQLGRRNITPDQASYLRGQRYLREKSQGARTDLTSGQSDQKSGTAEKLAEEFNVGEKTIRRDAEFAAAVDSIAEVAGEEARAAILSGEIPLNKQDVVELASLPESNVKEVVAAQQSAAKALRTFRATDGVSEATSAPNAADVITSVLAALAESSPVTYRDAIDEAMERVQCLRHRNRDRDLESVVHAIRYGAATTRDIASESSISPGHTSFLLRQLVQAQRVGYNVRETDEPGRPQKIYFLREEPARK